MQGAVMYMVSHGLSTGALFLCIGMMYERFHTKDMEQMSGLSSRVLQYSFKKHFGLRPKEWHRRERLHGARAALMRMDAGLKISSLAFDFGFPSASDFSHRYRQQFGELPSETMQRKA